MKVRMIPSVSQLSNGESGIHTVIRQYMKHGPGFGVEFVDDDNFDVLAIHAGTSNRYDIQAPIVAMLHGLYFTADFHMDSWAYNANRKVIDSIRYASAITVPSDWVGEIIKRDFRVSPFVIPHGVDWNDWQGQEEQGDYILSYAKNRDGVDVCDSTASTHLALRNPNIKFVATFSKSPVPENIQTTGVIAYDAMKKLVQGAAVFINSTKETFGIAALEAMASGVPVLCSNHGQVPHLVQHGVGGYCYQHNNIEDMEYGMRYCLQHRQVLGANARQLAKRYSWEAAMPHLVNVFESAHQSYYEPNDVSVIIPVYNKQDTLERAVNSALHQTRRVKEVIIVDDGSTDSSFSIASSIAAKSDRVRIIKKDNGGVATARNAGICKSNSRFVACLDADDWFDSQFIEACVAELESDKGLGIAYTGLQWHKPDGTTGLSDWPGDWNYDDQLKRKNQVPTACVFRKEMWLRLGGYRQRYAPLGAGSEDAEFWTRAGAYGYKAKKVTDAGLFNYSWMTGIVSGNPDYQEIDWLAYHPWVVDGKHPIGSYATPAKSSHLVRQYDEPIVSVIIPVGPGHEETVINALDSLEAQTFRQWEAIVAWDSPESFENLLVAYPYIRLNDLGGGNGAGYARNRGVDISRAPFLLFLDADDWLYPNALERMLEVWGEEEAGVYTDYIGIADVEDLSQLAVNLQKNVLNYDEAKSRAVIRYNAADFDCAKAMRQPENPPYIWNNVTTLIPTQWHYDIGGFDETMESWEDILYFYKMAWYGKCFVRIPEPLMVYQFGTGSRRDTGLKNWDALIKYIKDEKDGMRLQQS